jgi:hypothetical protein
MSSPTKNDFALHAPITMKEAWGIYSSSKTYTFEECMRIKTERMVFLSWFADIRYEYADAMANKSFEKSETFKKVFDLEEGDD